MNRDADLERLLAIDLHRTNAAGHHRFRNVVSACARDLHFFTAANSHTIGQFSRHFDERLRHELDIHRIILGPVVIVLGKTVGGTDDVELRVTGFRIFVHIRLILFHDRIVGLFRMQQIRKRALDRLVEFGERSVLHSTEWHE